MGGLFVVTVASEKGGVGKTTIATNLAVYLKALREDLPVTIASFDNHFSVDQMFILGPRPDAGIADFFDGAPLDGLASLGQYGVQYVASARRLQAPGHPPEWLRQRLDAAGMTGILILDTRPIMDWFAEAALLASDLVIVPVKDRAALVNANALRQTLAEVEGTGRLWLLPSLVDTRARLNADVRVHEFLVYAARERNYQVMDFCISKSPKVESLASGFSSRIRPVLTHARNTAVHAQFKQLAEFVLNRLDNGPARSQADRVLNDSRGRGIASPGLPHRQVRECPACCRRVIEDNGHFFFDMRSRRRGYLHQGCFAEIFTAMRLGEPPAGGGIVALILDGPGRVANDCRLTAQLCSLDGELLASVSTTPTKSLLLGDVVAFMTGRSLDQAYRELVFMDLCPVPIAHGAQPQERFRTARRRMTRELHMAGLL